MGNKPYLLILAAIMLNACGTPKYITVKETEYIKDTVKIKADTVKVEVPVEVQVNVVPQLDTLRMETSVAEAEAYLDTPTQTLKGTLKNKKTELKKEIQTIEKTKFVERKVEVPVPYEVVKTKVPLWAWIMLSFNVSLLIGFLIKLKFRL